MNQATQEPGAQCGLEVWSVQAHEHARHLGRVRRGGHSEQVE